MKPKICVISYDGLPTDGSGFIRTLKEIRSLSKIGYKVIGLSIKKYNNIAEKDEYYGAKIIRIKFKIKTIAPYTKMNIVKKIFYLFIFNIIAMLKIFKEAYKLKNCIYHCVGIYSIIPGYLLKLVDNKNIVIYDAIEPTPNKVKVMKEFGIFAIILSKILKQVEEFIASKLNAIFVTPSSCNEYYKRFKKINSNTTILYNVPEIDWSIASNNNRREKRNEFLLVYMGTLTEAKGLKIMLKVIEKLREEYPVKLRLIGTSNESLKKNGIEVIGRIHWKDVPHYLKGCDLALHLYEPLPGIVENMGTASLFEYLSMGIPIIASNFPAYKFLKESKCGVLVDPSNTDEITNIIIEFINNPKILRKMSINARKAFERKYNWNKEEKKLLKVYEVIVNG